MPCSLVYKLADLSDRDKRFVLLKLCITIRTALYTPSLGQSNNIARKYLTRIASGLTTAHNAQPIGLWLRTDFTAAPFYASQELDAYMDCLRQAVAARGAPIRLYMDNAKIDAHRVFEAHRADGHRGSLPTRYRAER
jgi:hypothetical protein